MTVVRMVVGTLADIQNKVLDMAVGMVRKLVHMVVDMVVGNKLRR